MIMNWKSLNIVQLTIAWICLPCINTKAADPKVVFDEIYDAEHLSDVLFSMSSGVTVRHAVLILFTPACGAQIDKWRRMHDKLLLPDDNYMFFGIHDYESSEKYTWYEWTSNENLTSWFNMTSDCSQLFYLPKGSTKSTKPVTLTDKNEFLNWIWDQVKVKVSLVNEAPEDVIFSFKGQYKAIPDVTVQPGEKKVVNAYTSYMSSATGDKGFYGGWVLGYTAKTLTAHIPTNQMTGPQFMSEQHNTMANRREMLDKDVWDYADRHLLNRKQPLMLPNFTTTGYQKLSMPKWIKNILQDFYFEQKEQRHSEDWEPGMTGINMDRQRCGMVELDNATKEVIAAGLHPLLEEWSNCKLTMTAFYGIREYYKGHRLKKHVDRIGTHIISVILQVVQDLNGGPDWELEVINFEGNRKHIQLKAGEMLFYESARLIHGRPKVFQGKVMANAFLHFKPATGWLFERPSSGKLFHDGKNLVNVYPLRDEKTLSTLQAKAHGIVDRVKDEL